MKRIILTLAFFTFTTTLMFSQPNPSGRPDRPVGEQPDPIAPVATATMLLLGLGGGYATYKLNKKKEK